MLESKYFIFNDIHSKDFGVSIVSLDQGLLQDPFLPTRIINERKVSGRDKPYFQGVKNQSLSFNLIIYIKDYKDTSKLRRIARWLHQDYYKPLIFESNPNRIFYAMIEGESNLFHNGMDEGVITLNVRCDSPYSYTPEYVMNNIEFRDDNKETSIINQYNDFEEGVHINTEVTSNGLTVKGTPEKWGDIYPMVKTWGELK